MSITHHSAFLPKIELYIRETEYWIPKDKQ